MEHLSRPFLHPPRNLHQTNCVRRAKVNHHQAEDQSPTYSELEIRQCCDQQAERDCRKRAHDCSSRSEYYQ
jgi:hypothetical protein